MNIKTLAIAALFAFSATAAMASPVVSNIVLPAGNSASKSADLSVTHTTKGAFTDTFYFTGLDGFALVNGTLLTMGKVKNDIDFTSATLNGLNFTFELTAYNGLADYFEDGTLASSLLTGPFTLIVNGVAGADWTGTGAVAATYSANFNFQAQPQPATVPEPASLALLGLAAAAALFATRRRVR